MAQKVRGSALLSCHWALNPLCSRGLHHGWRCAQTPTSLQAGICKTKNFTVLYIWQRKATALTYMLTHTHILKFIIITFTEHRFFFLMMFCFLSSHSYPSSFTYSSSSCSSSSFISPSVCVCVCRWRGSWTWTMITSTSALPDHLHHVLLLLLHLDVPEVHTHAGVKYNFASW